MEENPVDSSNGSSNGGQSSFHRRPSPTARRSTSQPRGESQRKTRSAEGSFQSESTEGSAHSAPATYQAAPRSPDSASTGRPRPRFHSHRSASDSFDASGSEEVPERNTFQSPANGEVQLDQILRSAANQGNYTVLSVLQNQNLEGCIQFQDEPEWLPRHRQQWEHSRALIVVLDLHDGQERAALFQLGSMLESSNDERIPIFAVHFEAVESPNFVQQWSGRVRQVLASGMDDFFWIDSRFFDSVETALIRIDVQRFRERQRSEQQSLAVDQQLNERVSELDTQLARIQDHIEYIMWSWVPRQLQLDEFIGDIDRTVEEREDGSIGGLQFIRNLGQGAFGEVHEARTQTGQSVAVKVIRKDNIQTIQRAQRVYREIQTLATLPPHEHLVQLHDVIHSIDTIYVCLSYGGPQNLLHFQMRQPDRTFSFDVAREIFGQITGAVGHMHRHGFYHLDIKPENVAVNTQRRDSASSRRPPSPRQHSSVGNDRISTTLVDCGLSVYGQTPLQHPGGSLPFAAPEILDEPCWYFGGPADSFALGMVLFEFVRGQRSMETFLGWSSRTEPTVANGRHLRHQLANGPPNINQRQDEPRAVTQLLVGLLQIDPARRMSLRFLLRSQWLRTIVRVSDEILS